MITLQLHLFVTVHALLTNQDHLSSDLIRLLQNMTKCIPSDVAICSLSLISIVPDAKGTPHSNRKA